MLRTQISLTENERRALDAASARTGRSISALIRDAVDAVYGCERSVEDDQQAMRRAFGAWPDRDLDGAAWVDRLRPGFRPGDRSNDTPLAVRPASKSSSDRAPE